jgi:hypothetical protein
MPAVGHLNVSKRDREQLDAEKMTEHVLGLMG